MQIFNKIFEIRSTNPTRIPRKDIQRSTLPSTCCKTAACLIGMPSHPVSGSVSGELLGSFPLVLDGFFGFCKGFGGHFGKIFADGG